MMDKNTNNQQCSVEQHIVSCNMILLVSVVLRGSHVEVHGCKLQRRTCGLMIPSIRGVKIRPRLLKDVELLVKVSLVHRHVHFWKTHRLRS